MIMALWGIALASAAVAFGLKLFVPGLHVVVRGIVVLGVYGLLYIGGAVAAGIPEAADAFRPIKRYFSGAK